MSKTFAIILLVVIAAALGASADEQEQNSYGVVDWPQDGSRVNLELSLQLLSDGQVQLTWVPYPDVGVYVICEADLPLPVNSPAWCIIGESSDNNYLVSTSSSRCFWHVRPKVVTAPVFTPPSGFYPEGQTITMSTFPENAWMMFKLDYQNNSAPSYEYYHTPLPTVSSTPRTIRAWAVKTGWLDSNESFGVFSTPPIISQPVPLANTLQTVMDDMNIPGQGFPHGVDPYNDWYDEAVIHNPLPPPSYQAFTAWGLLYEETRGNPAGNSRAQIRNLRAAYFSTADGTWHPLQNNGTPIVGKWYYEDFRADSSFVADTLYLADGSISATAGEERCFHFWIRDRACITDLPISNIFVTFEARLVLDEPVPDDRLNARYIMAAGGDYWTSVTDGCIGEGDIGNGRFKYLTTDWQSFNFCTMSSTQMQVNPPPFTP